MDDTFGASWSSHLLLIVSFEVMAQDDKYTRVAGIPQAG